MRSLSDLVTVVWNIAAAEALSADFEFILREHFFIALTELDKLTDVTARKLNFNSFQVAGVKTESSYLDKFFLKAKINKKNLRRELREILGKGRKSLMRGSIHRDRFSHDIFAKAQGFTENNRQTNGLDLLKAILFSPTKAINDVLKKQNKTPQELLKILSKIEHQARVGNPEIFKPKPYIPPPDIDKILAVGSDLVEKASQGLIKECIGRKTQIRKIINILKRKTTKKSIILTGKKGTGRNTIIETVALKIYKRNVPEILEDTTIIKIDQKSVNLPRICNVITEAVSRSEVILYFENLDELFGKPGASEKKICNILSEEINSGDLRILASIDKKNIKNFSRYFEIVEIKEPSPEELLEIIRQWKENFELKYNVKITPGALNAIVTLGKKLDIPGSQPQKALDILGQACIRAGVSVVKQDEEILNKITRAAKRFNLRLDPDVNEVWIAYIFSEILKTDILRVAGYLDSGVSLRFSRMKSELGQKILGQEYAINKIVNGLKRGFSDAGRKKTPLMFLFAGPRGVGKTEIARHIPHYIFGKDCEVVFFDMKQFNTDTRVIRLFGNDSEVGILPQVLKENPFQVFLFENIEHSAESFYNALQGFIRSFDVDLSRSIFIMTTAAASGAWSDVGNVSEERIISRAAKKLMQVFQKNFLDKIENIVMFKSVGQKHSGLLMAGWIDEKRAEVFNRTGVKIHISPITERALTGEGSDREFGVRRLRVIFEDLFAGVIEKYIERKMLAESKDWQFKIKQGHAVLEPVVTAGK